MVPDITFAYVSYFLSVSIDKTENLNISHMHTQCLSQLSQEQLRGQMNLSVGCRVR